MEEQRRIFESFLSLFAQKARPVGRRVANVYFLKKGEFPHPSHPLIEMTVEDMIGCEKMDCEQELVRWLLNQMSTYDCYTQKVVALVFDDKIVLSDVIRQV